MLTANIKKLSSKPYPNALCYPNPNRKEVQRRIRELNSLGVKTLIFQGKTLIGSLPILGKGCVSIAIKAETRKGVEVLKIRRTDADRPSMQHEAEMLTLANSVGVGPKLSSYTNNFMLMDLAEGDPITSWVKKIKGKGTTARLRRVIRSILDQCFRLDQLGLDHGELSNPSKHIFVDEAKVTIIDFETASTSRRTSNLTAVVQYVFIGGSISRKVKRILRTPSQEALVPMLRAYKEKCSELSYDKILEALGLT